MDRERLTYLLAPVVVTVVGLLLWEAFCVVFSIEAFLLPRPSLIWRTLVGSFQPIMYNAGFTLFTTLIGFALSVVVGMALGIAIGAWVLAYAGLYPLLVAFNSVPKVALVPILVIWFGTGAIPAVLTAFSAAFLPIAVNVATGLITVEPELKDVLRALGASNLQIIRKIGVPRSLPFFFASLKIAIAFAFVGAVVSETVAADRGIGYMMIAASSRFDVPLVFAGLVVVAAMGVVMYAICVLIERRYIGWAVRGLERVT
ncbi:MAG: ABC transporter permease [Betaproteobacteria bacterium]|nr:MAG: ABC transporter permease [Betaproteobacteria bacterium]